MSIYDQFSEKELAVLRLRAERVGKLSADGQERDIQTALVVSVGGESYALSIATLIQYRSDGRSERGEGTPRPDGSTTASTRTSRSGGVTLSSTESPRSVPVRKPHTPRRGPSWASG